MCGIADACLCWLLLFGLLLLYMLCVIVVVRCVCYLFVFGLLLSVLWCVVLSSLLRCVCSCCCLVSLFVSVWVVAVVLFVCYCC